jgi:hypothetical protein
VAGYFVHCCACSVPSREIGIMKEMRGVGREEWTCCTDEEFGSFGEGLYMDLLLLKREGDVIIIIININIINYIYIYYKIIMPLRFAQG